MLEVLAAAGDVLDHRLVELELHAQLVEVGDLELRAEPHAAAIGRELAEQQRSSVVLPAPFGPIRPMRSPRRMRSEKSRTIGAPPKPNETRSASTTSLPDACASSTPNCARALHLAPPPALLAHRDERAHAALVARAARLDAAPDPGLLLRELLVEQRVVALLLFERGRLPVEEARVVARPRRELRRGRARGCASRAASSSARSCVTKSTPPRSSSSASSSHSITSTSRWFVGSSSSSRSGSPTSARASATRRRQPPESVPMRRVGVEAVDREHVVDALVQAPAVLRLDLVLQLLHAAAAATGSSADRRARRGDTPRAARRPRAGRSATTSKTRRVRRRRAAPARAARSAAPAAARPRRRRARRCPRRA